MSSLLYTGSGLIAFGPAIALAVCVVGTRPPLVIVTISSAFFWLVSAVVSSFLWLIFQSMPGESLLLVISGVAVQEYARIAYVKVYHHMEGIVLASAQRSLIERARSGRPPRQQRRDPFPLHDFPSAIAAGVGWGGMHAVMMSGVVLSEDSGAGVMYADSCIAMPLVLLTSLTAWMFFLLDVAFMIIVFSAVGRADSSSTGEGDRTDGTKIALVVGLHMAASCVTVLEEVGGGCSVSLPVLAVLVFGVCLLATSSVPALYARR